MTDNRLKSFVERIEKLEEERKAIGGDIKDVYSEAKGVGYDVATMRKIVALRAKDSADVAEQETLLDVYKHALGMLTGGTVTTVRVPQEPTEEELEERAGRIAAEVDRCMYLGGPGQMPSISAIQEALGCSLGKASKIRKMVADRISREIAKVREMKEAAEEESDIGNHDDDLDLVLGEVQQDGDDGITESCGGVESRHACKRLDGENHSTERAFPKVENRKVPSGADEVRTETGAEPEPELAPGPHDTVDDLAIPPFLRGPAKKAEGPLAGGEQGRAQRAHT